MKNKDFIKKYNIRELESICDEVYTNLSVLYYDKKIPKFKVLKKQKKVKFYHSNNFILFDIAEIYSMSDNKIIKIANKKIRGEE